MKEFEYQDLVQFTNNFSIENYLGGGGFADVYKGVIPEVNDYGLPQQTVAVKRAKILENAEKMASLNQQFEVEKNYLGAIFKHPNIIELVGYCFTGERKCLVLEFAAGGKLTDSILGLTWKEIKNIVLKLGKTIEYIHCTPGKCLHGDIKPDNVLLTADKEPKLSDFGTFRRENDEDGNTAPVQTPWYNDPEGKKRSGDKKTQQDDVYAFGVIIHQLIMKRDKAMEPGRAVGETMHITDVAWELFVKQKSKIVHESLLSIASRAEAKNMSKLAVDLTETLRADDDAQERVRNEVERIFFQDDDDADSTPLYINEEDKEYFERPHISDVMRALEDLKRIDKYQPLSKKRRID